MITNTKVIVVAALLALAGVPVHAQYLTPSTGGTIGGACTNGTFTWPDSNGYFLKCVSGAWVKLSSGLSTYPGNICQRTITTNWPAYERGYFIQSIDPYGNVTCAQPHAYTSLSGTTNNTQTAASTTYYFGINGATNLQTTDTNGITRTPVPHAGTIQNLYVVTDVANSAGKTNTYTVMKNGSAQTLTCSITNAASCNDTTHTFTVSAGDTIGIKLVTDSGAQLVKSAWAVEMSY